MVYQGGLNGTNIKTTFKQKAKKSIADRATFLMIWDFVPGIKKICGVAIKITAFVQSSINPLLNIAFYQKKPFYVLLNSIKNKSA